MPMASVNPVQEEQKQSASPLENFAKVLGMGVSIANAATSAYGALNPAPAGMTGKQGEAIIEGIQKLNQQAPKIPVNPTDQIIWNT